jgi:Transposase domain (DUF772)
LRIRLIEPRAWDQVHATGSVCDRLIWMRFLGLGLGDAIPDANTIWTFREALKGRRDPAPVGAVRSGATVACILGHHTLVLAAVLAAADL